jgi:3-oxoacid CoA-transferase subunit A
MLVLKRRPRERIFIDPDIIVTPGIFVQGLVEAVPRVKDIEQRTVRPRPADVGAELTKGA